jgi:hypothetical protein
MGIYTVRSDAKVDTVISRDLEIIVRRVREAISAHAVVLGGGFGRGEGSVLVDGADIRPVNDYDIFLAVSDHNGADLKRLSHELAKEVGIRSIDLIPIRYPDLERLPATQFHYDLKYGGTLLWGENILQQMPDYRKGCVEQRSGGTLLLNRLVCALEAYSERFVHNGMNGEEKFFLVNQTGKVVSACVEALLITKGKYHHSYLERRNIFDAEFSDWHALRRLNSQATEFKLLPSKSPTVDAIGYWEETLTEYLKVLTIYFAPKFLASRLGLWARLAYDRRRPISSNPIEIVELILLLGRREPSLTRGFTLAQARRRLENISHRSFSTADWEILRAGAVLLWHQLCH